MPAARLQVRSPGRLRWPRRTARLRLTAVYSGLFLLSSAALVAMTYVLFQQATAYRKPLLPQIPHTSPIQRLQQLQVPKLPQLPQALYLLAQDQQQLVQDQQQIALSVPQLAAGPGPLVQQLPQLARDESQLAVDQRALTQDQHSMVQDQRQVSRAVTQLAHAVHQIVQAGSVEAAQRAADSHQLLVNSGIALAIVAVLALVAGWLVAGRILRPIRTITRTARRISSTNLHERLALDGPEDELKELGDTLDDLFGRLDAAFEAQRHFVANASHELRTPLTRERTLVQVALGDPSTSEVWRSTGQELLASNREQETLMEALLTLASSEGGIDRRERIDLAELCPSVLARPLDPDHLGLSVGTAIGPAPLDGDRRLVERLLANLVDNAIRHNIADGHVRVSTSVMEGRAVLLVTNTGPVIPASEVIRLFQPFQRLDGRRTHHDNGHGLGLSIVHAIATAHGAAVTAAAFSDGGLSVEVTFPPLAGFRRSLPGGREQQRKGTTSGGVV